MTLNALHLSFAYSAKTILKDITFTLPGKGLTCLLGKNGSGKSTLLKCLLGLLPYSGEALISDKDIKKMSYRERAKAMAYIPQATQCAFGFSVIDMVIMGTANSLGQFSSPGPNEYKIALEALNMMDLMELKDRNFQTLSGGEKQLVLIARALAQKSEVLLMDEPCSSLDYGNQAKVMACIKKLSCKEYSILMSTHSPEQAFLYADRALTLTNGEIGALGLPKEVLTEKHLSELYGIPVEISTAENGRLSCSPQLNL